jgi:Meiotically up-regulated gene 113
MTTNVYFIRCNEFVKIGRGNDPESRMRTLQIGSPYELEFMGAFEATPAEEGRLHTILEQYRYRGEWFYLIRERLEELPTR